MQTDLLGTKLVDHWSFETWKIRKIKPHVRKVSFQKVQFQWGTVLMVRKQQWIDVWNNVNIHICSVPIWYLDYSKAMYYIALDYSTLEHTNVGWNWLWIFAVYILKQLSNLLISLHQKEINTLVGLINHLCILDAKNYNNIKISLF